MKFVVIIAIVVTIGIMLPIAFAVTPTIDTSKINHHPAAINLSDSSNSERKAVVVVKGDNVHVAWADETNSNVLYKKSSDGGATFATKITVGSGSLSTLSTYPVSMDVSGNFVHIVWNGNSKTVYARSTDGGTTFAATVDINNGGRPRIAATGSTVYVIGWGGVGDDKVKFSKSTNNGASFGVISDAGAGGIVSAIDATGNNIYIMARDGASTMKLHKSTNGGTGFATSTIATGSDFPNIEQSQTYLHASYKNAAATIGYLISMDNGANWGTAMTSPLSTWSEMAPSMSNGTGFSLAWRYDDLAGGQGQILYAKSTDSGQTFDTIQQVSGLGRNYNNQDPYVAANGTNVAVVFTACTNNLSNNICNIFFTKSNDSGNTFTPPSGTTQISYVIGTNTIDRLFNATNAIATSIVDIFTTTPSTGDYTIVTPNLNATFAPSTSPNIASHSSITIKNSTRSINTISNPSASVVGTIQELGYTNSTSISFDKMVKLTFEGTTGSTPFFINATDTYTINSCSGTPATASQAASDSTITSGARECYWTASNATKFVWTYHFTAFGTGNNFGSSSSSSSSSSGGGGGGSCDLDGLGNTSLRVYEVSYDVDTYQVLVQAYSTCGPIKAKITTSTDQSILGMSTDQPLLDDNIIIYSTFLDESDKKFTLYLENKRVSFTDTFNINGKSILKSYTGDTGYTSIQEGTSLPVLTSEQTTTESQLTEIQYGEMTSEEMTSMTQEESKEYVAEPIAEEVVATQESEGGGCLIATATYGSELAPQVQLLREIRDNNLLNTESGTVFMKTFNEFYYSFSPTIADWERESPMFKEAVKLAITPMITSLSLMENAESESEVLGLGLSIIALNLGMYLGIPAVVIVGIKKRF